MRIYIITGEPSGDLLGSYLLPYLKEHTVKGIGGPLMEKEGLISLFPQEDLSVMGFFEIIPHLYTIYKRFQQTIADIKLFQPDILLTIDSPGFCKRIIKKLRKEKNTIHFVHYAAPSVWAWREKRAQKWAKLVDHMLCLFPFEPAYFESYGLKATFVGHPIAEWKIPQEKKKKQLLVLPGSRKSELKKLANIFDEASKLYVEKNPDFEVIWFTRPHLKNFLLSLVPKAHVMCEEKDRIFSTSSLAIAASGTVTLELSYTNTPCVIGYKVSKLTEYIVKKLIKIPYVCILNILYGRKIVPECLQEECSPSVICDALEHLEEQPFPEVLKNKNPSLEIAKIFLENVKK